MAHVMFLFISIFIMSSHTQASSDVSCANKSTDTKELIHNISPSQVTPTKPIQFCHGTESRPTWYTKVDIKVETGYLAVQEFGNFVDIILDYGTQNEKTVCRANIFECPPSTIPVVGCYCSLSHYWFDNPVCFYEATLNITVSAEISQSESKITFQGLGGRYSRTVDFLANNTIDYRVIKLPVIEGISCTTTNSNDEDATDSILSKMRILRILPISLGILCIVLCTGVTIYWFITKRKRERVYQNMKA